ncbi:GrpB family protein [Natronomonas sp. EA1]|uniref:GrpB family protein n=1 Tax=Natronomonas sp. EA1 TaxID=3421655 RepID=UPI003EBB148C
MSDSLGLARGTVSLREYDPAWPKLFEAERDRLREWLPDAVAIEHVGSTAVPGLAAKPVLDITVALPSLAHARAHRARLEAEGYEYRPNDPVIDRAFYAKGPRDCRTHYLSLTAFGSDTWRDQLEFRDALRGSEELRAEYEALKRRLASAHAGERGRYTREKADFIERVLD